MIWEKPDPFGVELAEMSLLPDRLSATGVGIGSAPLPYRLEYELETSTGFITSRLLVRVLGQGWSRDLDLRRDSAGCWSASTRVTGEVDLPPPAGALPALDLAFDCDLAFSPLTNSMPILRHSLHAGGQIHDFLMAWVSLPDLGVRASPQRYVFVRKHEDRAVIRYESRDSDFKAELTVDAQGIVVDYPGIGRSVAYGRSGSPG